MATNKFAGKCEECGEMVLPGKSILTNEWSNQDDDTEWVVRHSDKSVCAAVEADQKNSAKCCDTYRAVKHYIETYGTKGNEQNGAEVLIDKRIGINQIGWIISADQDNTLYATCYEGFLDGNGQDYTYTLTDGDDDGFGNSNADIIAILRNLKNGIPANNLAPFAC